MSANSTDQSGDQQFSQFELELISYSVTFYSVTKSLLCLFGICLNLSLVYVTFRAKWIHGICNTLLAIYDACLVPYLAAFFPLQLAQSLAFGGKMSLLQCFVQEAVPLALFAASFPLMLSVAVDRFIGAAFPLHYKSVKRPFAIGLFLLLSAAYSAVYVELALQNAVQFGNISLVCTATAPLGDAVNSLAKSNFGLEFCAICLYAAIWAMLKRREKQTNSNAAADRRIFKSLFTILLVDFVGWTTNSLTLIALDSAGIRPDSHLTAYWFTTQTTNYLVYLSASSNAIMLYNFSTEYQRAFDTYLPFIPKCKQLLGIKLSHQQTNVNTILVGAAKTKRR